MTEETPKVLIRPLAVFGHADGVVLRAPINGDEHDILVMGPQRIELLNTLAHSLSAGELEQFRQLLKRQNR